MPTLEQQRAAYAWDRVQGCDDKYTKLAKGAPALIMGNGLMQTLAFYQYKDQDHHKALNRHILCWLHERKLVSTDSFEAAMGDLFVASSADYRRATQEALELLKWVRQFAPALSGERG
jgi:CRISPR-associated protein Cmr5